MVTNYPQQLAAATEVTCTRSEDTSVVGRIIGRLSQVFCGLRGHESLVHVEGNRVMMRCTLCGHDTPGWEISARGPRKRFEGDTRRHLVAATPLVLRKSA